MRMRLPQLAIMAAATLTVLGTGLAATMPAAAQERTLTRTSYSQQAIGGVTAQAAGCSRAPGEGMVYAGAFVGTDSCSRCIDTGIAGIRDGAWRSYNCWTTVPGPGEWRTVELWVRGY